MGRYHMADLEPPAEDDRIIMAAERYDQSDRYDDDALEWVYDNPTVGAIISARTRYRLSTQYADTIQAIADGHDIL